MKMTASACANGVGLHEKPTPATRMHAIASHSAISRPERDDWLLMFSFFVVIVIAPFSVVPEPVGDFLSPAGSHRQAHCEPRATNRAAPALSAWAQAAENDVGYWGTSGIVASGPNPTFVTRLGLAT